MPNPYGPLLIEHFRHPRNRGPLANASVSEEGVNPLCGDRVRLELRIAGRTIEAAAFTANACALCVAGASVLTELVTGVPLDEADTLTVDDLLRPLGATVPASRLNCVRLPLTVMHAGVALYRRTHQLPDAERARPVAAVVLAAGRARRFGAQKLLAPYGGSTVIRTVVEAVQGADVAYVVVVTGAGGEAIRGALAGRSVVWAENPAPEQGMSGSVAAGLGALPPNVGAVLVVLGDQPTVSGTVVERLVATWRGGGGPVVAPRYRGERGNPVLFDRTLFGVLGALEGDRGARDFLKAHPELVTLVDVADPPPLDVDTPADYDDLLRRRAARG